MEKNYQVVTNNPLVKEKYMDRVIFIDGGFEDVLFKVRDLVHIGFEMISHPLGASIRMFFSPYRSIVVREEFGVKREVQAEIIENSIMNYKKNMSNRREDLENSKDYSIIDMELLRSSLEEFERVYN